MMTTANKLSALKSRTRPRSNAWLERQRKFYERMHADEGGFDFIEFLNGDIVVRTVPEYAHIPEGATVILDMPTSITHQRIQSRLMVALSNFVNQHELGEVFGTPTDLRLGTNVVQPDILFLSKEHASRAKTTEILGYADLVIEILSKHSIKRDRQTKFRLYQDAKIPSYWIVSPEAAQLELYRLTKDGYDMTAAYSSDETLRYEFASGKTFELNLRTLFQ
ncbi:MAG: Uma2 family endonuclease [Chloroherpetonaceae bacterium]